MNRNSAKYKIEFDRSRLLFHYDTERLQRETLELVHQYPSYIHYSVIPLTAAVERRHAVSDYSDPDWAHWRETPELNECPYIQEILDLLKCRVTNVRLLRLEPGGELKLHTDPQLDLNFRNQVRLHIPVITNDCVEFLLNGKEVPLRAGELWYLRLSDPHQVRNAGTSERIQLSIDVVVNEWIEGQILMGVTGM